MDFLSISVLSNKVTQYLSEGKGNEVMFPLFILIMIGFALFLVFALRRKR